MLLLCVLFFNKKKRYLNKFKYQNVDQFDLWDTLNQVDMIVSSIILC